MRALEYLCACALLAFTAIAASGLITLGIFLSPVILY